MKYVIDSGVAVKFVIPEIDSDKAIRLIAESTQGIHQFIAPDLFPTEVCNALMMAERRARIPAGMADPLFQDLLKVCPALQQAIPLLPRALQLAQQFQKSVYDCLFVSLAERESCELVSADDRLVNGAARTDGEVGPAGECMLFVAEMVRVHFEWPHRRDLELRFSLPQAWQDEFSRY